MRFAVFIYDGVEPVDLATYGVLSMARRIAPEISMFTVAPQAGEVKMANGLRVIADHGFADCPPCDALIVTGGPGWMAQCESPRPLAFLRSYEPGRVMAGVCTGGMILAAAGPARRHARPRPSARSPGGSSAGEAHARAPSADRRARMLRVWSTAAA